VFHTKRTALCIMFRLWYRPILWPNQGNQSAHLENPKHAMWKNCSLPWLFALSAGVRLVTAHSAVLRRLVGSMILLCFRRRCSDPRLNICRTFRWDVSVALRLTFTKLAHPIAIIRNRFHGFVALERHVRCSRDGFRISWG
jgi:hypothetical protein